MIDPIDAVLPFKSVGGVALANLVAVLALVALCFLAGLAARLAVLSAYSRRVDAFLIELLPGYAVAKSMVGGMVRSEEALGTLLPVLVRFDDYATLAFEVERAGSAVVVFLPGAPSAWSGTSVLVEPSRVTRLELKPHEVAGKLRVLGRGSAQYASMVAAPDD